MPVAVDITGGQIQKRTDLRIFMRGIFTIDDNVSVLVEFECHLRTDIAPSS